MTTEAPEPAPPPDEPGPLTATADDVGLAILAAVRDELKGAKKAYVDLDEHAQDLLLRRLEVAIRNAVRAGFSVMVAADFPSAVATLDKVAFTPKGVQGTVSLSAASEHRHALSDHAGRPVLVVLASAEGYLERMGELRGEKQQADLFFEGAKSSVDESGLDTERHDTVAGDGDDVATGDGSGEPTAPIDDPNPGELTREAVLALLEIANVEGVDLVDVSAWDQETRGLVADWAGAMALRQSHPEVHVPAMPAVLIHDEEDPAP